MTTTTKTLHRLQLPYPPPEWPTCSTNDENLIVQHLLDLLKPIGDHRRRHVIPSKGKRREKRKRSEKEHAPDEQPEQSQRPAIADYLTIGFNSTVKSLEALSSHSKPPALADGDVEDQEPNFQSMAAVFVCRSGLPELVTTSIPLLVATASLAQPQHPPIRLVQLSAPAEVKLAQALHQPRAGFVGLQVGISGGDVLLALVRAAVEPVTVPWLDSSSDSPRYLAVQIESIEAPVGKKKVKVALDAQKHSKRTSKQGQSSTGSSTPSHKNQP